MIVNTLFLIQFLYCLDLTFGDVYMHTPRGSNDRNCERNANRNNGNRLFDSQNNNAGGYACPRAVGNPAMGDDNGAFWYNSINDKHNAARIAQSKRMYYYEDSILAVEWTDQHGCGGNSKVNCEMVLQYACEDTLDPLIDDFWPWVKDKAEVGSRFRGRHHFKYVEDNEGDPLNCKYPLQYSGNGNNVCERYHVAAPRDGIPINPNDAATDTIPDNFQSARPNTRNTRRFGMHESYDFYQLCQRTERNKGLYTADQNIRRRDQRGTRQNPNGNRNGLECPEERDYYPWWHPSPWIDIAVLTDSALDTPCYNVTQGDCSERCHWYQQNTMNFYKKGYCDVNHTDPNANVNSKLNHRKWQRREWFNNKEACENNNFVWYEISHNDNIDLTNNPFVCAHTQFARTNQLGNADNGPVVSTSASTPASSTTNTLPHGINANRFLWKVPKIPEMRKSGYAKPSMTQAYQSCVLRIRYNISSADFEAWPRDASGSDRVTPMMNVSNNIDKSTNPPSYDNTPLVQDPYYYIAPMDDQSINPDVDWKTKKFVSLAVNTNQYSRTFQDRSYVFSIRKHPDDVNPVQRCGPLVDPDECDVRDSDIPSVDVTELNNRLASGGRIININVRGKRGNIVQTFPSVEYDFVPNSVSINDNDIIHFQWTGSDYNPRRGCNNGEGGPPDPNTFNTAANANKASRADRSNIVFTDYMAENVPKDYLSFTFSSQPTDAIALHKARVIQFSPCANLSLPVTHPVNEACYTQTLRLAYLDQNTDYGSRVLRNNEECFTQERLDNIKNSDTRENHPLNCAKMNAKFHPYFDGGLLFPRRGGIFSYFSSRNNNFSNRQQIGVLCVNNDTFSCSSKIDRISGALQDQNPMTTGRMKVGEQGGQNINTRGETAQRFNAASSPCEDTASNPDGQANANGAQSCFTTSSGQFLAELDEETFFVQEGDNDNFGDGNAIGCPVLTVNQVIDDAGDAFDEIMVASVCLAIGLVTSWIAYYIYNRYQQKKLQMDQLHRGQKGWVYDGDDIIMDDYKISAFSGAAPSSGTGSSSSSRQLEMMSRTFSPSPPKSRGAESYKPSIKGAGAFAGSGLAGGSPSNTARETYNPSQRFNASTGNNGGSGRVGINAMKQHESRRAQKSPDNKYFSPDF